MEKISCLRLLLYEAEDTKEGRKWLERTLNNSIKHISTGYGEIRELARLDKTEKYQFIKSLRKEV